MAMTDRRTYRADGLIDLDDAGVGARVIDIGYAVVHAAVDITGAQPDWTPAIARAFLAGYRAHCALTSAEIAALPDAMAFGSLIYVIADWVPAIQPREWARASWMRANRARIAADIA